MNYSDTSIFESKLAPGVKFTLRKMSHKRRIELKLKVASFVAKGRDVDHELEPVLAEISRAEEAAKIEPCTCKHGMAEDLPSIAELLANVAKANAAMPDGMTPVELTEICHSATSKRCLIPACECRKPLPADNAYSKRDELQIRDREILVNDIYPEYIRWGVKSIDGLEINDVTATVDTLIADAPEALMTEVVDEIQRLIKLSPSEQFAFNMPTISGAPVDGQTQSSSAPTAGVVEKPAANLCTLQETVAA